MTIEFYSLEQQDEFILNLFDHKRNGTFLDVSCWHPIGGSNTYYLSLADKAPMLELFERIKLLNQGTV